MNRVLITGVAGSIGSELARQLVKNNKVIGLDQDESGLFGIEGIVPEIANIRDRERIEEIFEKYKPKIVFHSAAYKHLSAYEKEHLEEVVETNVMGTINVIKASRKIKAKFIFISTDKAVNPTSLMGTTKLLGEMITKRYGGIIVRFGNVFGSRGSVIPIWQKQIIEGKPITITDPKMERYFMTIQEACSLVVEAARMGRGGEIFILDMGRQIKLIDLAMKIMKDMGKSVPIKITGIKEGEKLSEELYNEKTEKLINTNNKKIFKIINI